MLSGFLDAEILRVVYANMELLSVGRQSISILMVFLIALLFLSFVASGSRLAFFALKYKDINLLKLKADEASKRILRLLEEPKLLASVITTAQLIFNTGIVIITNYSIDALLNFSHPIPILEIIIKILIISSVLLLFCEMIPKVWAHHHTLSFIYFAAWWVESIMIPLFKSPSGWIAGITDRLENKRKRKSMALVTDEELDNAIDLLSEEEASVEEKQILKGIQKFGHITVKQVMRSRIDVNGIDWNLSYKSVVDQVRELHYSRYPVFKGNLDEIAGILQTKDLLPYLDEKDDFNWRQLIHTAFFVPEQKLIEDLLIEFQQKRTHIAIVVDEFGGTSGIVTMEDILEEIIGEIKDEFDEEETLNKKIDDNNYLFEGKTMIHEVCKIMGIPADSFDHIKGDSESLAGLILEVSERLPKVNDIIESGDFSFTILDAGQNRIQKVKVSINPIKAEM
jgi:gliding motility-associated protein GldE